MRIIIGLSPNDGEDDWQILSSVHFATPSHLETFNSKTMLIDQCRGVISARQEVF